MRPIFKDSIVDSDTCSKEILKKEQIIQYF